MRGRLVIVATSLSLAGFSGCSINTRTTLPAPRLSPLTRHLTNAQLSLLDRRARNAIAKADELDRGYQVLESQGNFREVRDQLWPILSAAALTVRNEDKLEFLDDEPNPFDAQISAFADNFFDTIFKRYSDETSLIEQAQSISPADRLRGTDTFRFQSALYSSLARGGAHGRSVTIASIPKQGFPIFVRQDKTDYNYNQISDYTNHALLNPYVKWYVKVRTEAGCEAPEQLYDPFPDGPVPESLTFSLAHCK